MKLFYLAPVLAAVCYSGAGNAAPQTTGGGSNVCQSYTALALPDVAGKRLVPGRYFFKITQPTKFTVDLVGGGGGGGAASNAGMLGRQSSAKAGGGGGAGQYVSGTYALDAGRYFIVVGSGGAGGVSEPAGSAARAGAAGGDTAVGVCASGQDLAPRARGGVGGRGDGVPSGGAGSPGASLRNPASNETIGIGGAGGQWLADGLNGAGWGSGGGGEGGTTAAGRHGGRGGDGSALLTVVG